MFNYKKFVRAMPATSLRPYLEHYGLAMPADLDWSASERHLHRVLIQVIDEADAPLRIALVADLQAASDLADEAGYRAIVNACLPGESLLTALQAMKSYADRALQVYWWYPAVFDRAQEIRFFDDHANRHATRRTQLNTQVPASRSSADLQALATTVAAFYREHDGTGEHCVIEITPRHRDGTLQLTLYLQGLADSRAEFEQGTLISRRAHPAMELALVHDAARGLVDTAVRGGKAFHERLLEAFVTHLLKADVQPRMLRPQRFDLTPLRRGVSVRNAAAYGIQQLWLKQLTLAARDATGGMLTITSPSRSQAASAEILMQRWFGASTPWWRRFDIVQATIAIGFRRPVVGRQRRPLTIDFRRDGTIRWDGMDEQTDPMIEGFLVEWGLAEPTQMPALA